MDLTVDGYLKAIVKSGEPPEHEILKAVLDLRIQYADAMGDNEYRMYCGIIRDMSILEITLIEIENLVKVLRYAYHPLLAKALNKLTKSSFVFDINNPKQYDEYLQRSLNRSKSIKINLDLKRISFKALEEKYNSKSGNATREYYQGILITLSESYELTDSISVWNFCERIKRFNKKHDAVKVKR